MKLEIKQSSWFIFGYFVLALIANFFLPDQLIWDENLFFSEINRYGDEYFPTFQEIKSLQSPMGPLYFIVYGLIGKITSFSLFWMRCVHIVFALILLLMLNRFFYDFRQKSLLILLFILNPYFFALTAPLLYTDVLGLIFVYLGVLLYIEKKSQLLAGISWALAIYTRQLFVIIPLAAILSDVIKIIDSDRGYWRNLIYHAVALFLFLPIFIIWDFGLNSGSFGENKFQENTLKAFSFSLSCLNYSIILIGLFAIPALYRQFCEKFNKPDLKLVFLAILFSVLAFPLNINADMKFGNLPDTAGLLDIAFNHISLAKYIVIPAFLYWGMSFLKLIFMYCRRYQSYFMFFAVALFLTLESFYAYCWDKHFLLITPFVLFLSAGISENRVLQE
ncbi:MAG: hypothetical protein K9G58_15195 [Bacteroidales bacterium]|nr:hypothetical protein [Bacteroidales bacterium]MCF8388714.1 hypothetical protein [Bacteroidales bacterium]MCF8399516.1 hypothetical protein [Bacteroidales bacterium]